MKEEKKKVSRASEKADNIDLTNILLPIYQVGVRAQIKAIISNVDFYFQDADSDHFFIYYGSPSTRLRRRGQAEIGIEDGDKKDIQRLTILMVLKLQHSVNHPYKSLIHKIAVLSEKSVRAELLPYKYNMGEMWMIRFCGRKMVNPSCKCLN